MATNAVILLHFGSKKLSITLSDHNLWQVSGDPQQVLSMDEGIWKYSVTAGTELIADGQTQIVLVGWKLTDDSENTGVAFLFPETANTVGDFSVTARV
ncbi:hypothetical protein [Citrobacter sp. Marseille-Q6884]|uniref:hypothetical protein n=1 Tax=Citrobacter sp. Marseille-Q6884 TaxID=2956786 RepID=UPI0021B3C3D8|nr:hypothetical protein [Citrobacter sp. Marseille-Q6884]